MLQIYTGNGKGKTTAAFGLCLRALGRGMRVCVFQFLKKAEGSGEVKAIKTFKNVTLLSAGGSFRIHEPLPEKQKRELRRELKNALIDCRKIMKSAEYNILVLDEANVAMSLGFLKVQDVVNLIKRKPPELELILTGRSCPEEILKMADLITCMGEVRHPYRKGIKQRKGIEY